VSKRFKGKLCAYCAAAVSTTADHIISREFFLVADRKNLPQAPACDKCNNEKSQLEHYATSVLPFGGRHPNAQTNLQTMVPKRLRKNAKLHRELVQQGGQAWSEESGGLVVPVMTVPLDSRRLVNLFSLIVKGLAWHHWGVYLTCDHFVKAMMVAKAGENLFDLMFFIRSARARVKADLGNGTFVYEGVQDSACPELTVWRICMYGGVRQGGDPKAPGQYSSLIGVVTGPNQVAQTVPGSF
jgi:hypothetical protein